MTYPRGSSLVEVLVAGSLALLVLGLGVGAWLFASRFMQRGTARAELQQVSLLALDRIARGLKEAGSHTVTVGSSLSFTRQEGVDDQGESRWAGEVLVYRLDAANRRLIEERYPPQPPALARQPSPSAAIVLTPGELAAIASQDNRRERVVASDVVEFSAAWSAGQTQPLTLSLKLERPLPQGPAVRFEISRQVSIRNP